MCFVRYPKLKSFDSNNEMNITSLQSISHGLKYIILISELISEMRHGSLI